MIYGWRLIKLFFQPCPGVKCQNCDAVNSLGLIVYQRYFHIFWIPVLPIGKVAYSYCENCKEQLTEKYAPEGVRSLVVDAKSQARAPWYVFVGIFLIVLGVAGNFVFGMYKNQQTSKYFESPKVNDVYRIKTDEGKYTFLKISSVDGDTINFYQSNWVYPVESGSEKADTNEKDFFDSQEKMTLSKDELKVHYDKGEIKEVIRE